MDHHMGLVWRHSEATTTFAAHFAATLESQSSAGAHEGPLPEFRAFPSIGATSISVGESLAWPDSPRRPRIIIGDNPILVGSWVHDLRIESISTGQQIVRWTQPAGLRFQHGANKLEPLSEPTERALRISTTGHVSELRDRV
jgi:hypothetical protein